VTTAPPGGSHRVTIAGSGENFLVTAGEPIHAAARRAGVWLPFECGWGGCGTCKATLVDGETRTLYADVPARDPRDQRRRRILLCQSTAATDLVIKPLRVDPGPPAERATADHRGRLAAVQPLGPGISRFRFDLTDAGGHPAVAAYRPGQFAVLELAPGLRRCYSMAGLPGGSQVEFVARQRPGGEGSGRLFTLRPGDEIGLELPYGDLWLRDGGRPLLVVSGGTGVSAVLALVAGLADGLANGHTDGLANDTVPGREVHVVHGATNRAELVCWDELEDLVGRIPGARLHGALLTPDDAWTGARGLVTDALGPLLPRLADADAYLVGPPPMVDAVRDQLTAHEVTADRIHYDRFG
jgi:toluene monooxygenase electron transfer component